MPFVTDLKAAISAGNLDQVQEILAERDQQGIPLIDINCDFPNVKTALLWALCCNPINELIIQTLLDVRDHANNPVCNINHEGPHGQTALSFVLDDNIEPNLRRRLLQRILDVRGANGELITDARSDQCNIPLLKKAQALNDIACFRILQDVRTITGAFALNINEIRNGTTVLDEAINDGAFGYRHNQAMIDAIQQLGGRSANNQGTPRIQEQRIRLPQPIAQPQIGVQRQNNITQAPTPNYNAIQNKEIRQFVSNRQNTHNTSLTVSIERSILNLKKRYPDVNTNETLQTIRLFLSQLPDSNTQKQHAIACLNRIECDPTNKLTDDGTTTRLSQALAIIWTAIEDPTALIDDIEQLTEQDIVFRKESLVKHLFQAQSEYGNNPGGEACFVGTLNKILETLDRCHPDVLLVLLDSTIMSIATERAHIIVRDNLKKKSLREQRTILKCWDTDDPDNGKTVATEFREAMVMTVDTELQSEFKQTLTKKQRDDITGAFEYLPRPILHKNLDDLIKTINQLHDHDNRLRQKAITYFKDQANHSYDECNRSLQEEYELLLSEYTHFEKLDTVFLKLLTITLNTNNPERNICIQRLKNRCFIAYINQSNNYTDELKSLCEDISFDDFFKLDQFITEINQLDDNQSKRKAIKRLKQQANDTYLEYSKSFAEKTNNLKNLRTHALFEANVDDILSTFEDKIDTIGSHHTNARSEAQILLNKLHSYKNEALKNLSKESLELFAKQSTKAIQQSTIILQKDLSLGDYLANVAKQLINAATTAIASIITLGTSKHHGFFTLKTSDAVKVSQEINQSIQTESLNQILSNS